MINDLNGKSKTLERFAIRNKNKIKEIEWDKYNEKYWVILKNHCDPHGAHTLAGETVKVILEKWRMIKPCDCGECQ